MAASLGKRKDREEDTAQLTSHGSTLFVSNLPFTATSVDLQTLFSDIAPVRRAFVVTEHETGISKGVGYVSFAIKEDAQAAYDKINNEGLTLLDRTLRVDWAGQKPKGKDRAVDAKEIVEEERIVKTHPHPLRAPQDPLAIRTIIVSGLPPSIDSKALWKKFRKYDGAERVEWPSKTPHGGEESSVAHVLFNTPSNASNAITKLHGHVFKGSLLSVTLKKRLDSLAKSASSKTVKSKEGSVRPTPASRLIVRNLPFDITEQDLRAIFLPYGPIYSVHIPTAIEDQKGNPQEEKRPAVRSKGFAFVWMLSKKDAEKAIEGCNGTAVRAGTAETLISNKQKKKKQRREEERRKAVMEAEEGKQDNESKSREDEMDNAKANERIIAVDWALSKAKWEEEKAKMEEEEPDNDLEEDEDENHSHLESGEGSDEEIDVTGTDDEDEDDNEGEGLGVHHEDEEEDSNLEEDSEGESDDEEEFEASIRPTLPPPETGTTLFIRNVPFDATEDELRTMFRAFGPLRYARITMDHATGRSRGTGFACFWDKADADKVIERSELLRSETTAQTLTSKKNPFTMPSILTPDPSSSMAQSLVLHGRTLDVVRAVTRDEATKLKDAGERMREKADKRNTYLLREGVILPNTPSAENLAPADVERRTASFNARRNLLKSNPSLYISKTRLSVRQIPLFVTDHMLKRLAIHAVRAFEADVKKGARKGLSDDELAVGTQIDQADDISDKEGEVKAHGSKAKKRKFSMRKTGVKQSKIIRQVERVDPITGQGRSKGYGFIEMYKHADALRVLRWANNNLNVNTLFEQWWIDELKDLVKREKAKGDGTDEARLKRMTGEIERKDSISKKSRGTLIVEFSIENIQVVKRRSELQSKVALVGTERTLDKKKETLRKSDSEKKEAKGPPKKKRRLSESQGGEKETGTAPEKVKDSPKPGNKIGSIIGRKRMERKAKKVKAKR